MVKRFLNARGLNAYLEQSSSAVPLCPSSASAVHWSCTELLDAANHYAPRSDRLSRSRKTQVSVILPPSRSQAHDNPLPAGVTGSRPPHESCRCDSELFHQSYLFLGRPSCHRIFRSKAGTNHGSARLDGQGKSIVHPAPRLSSDAGESAIQFAVPIFPSLIFKKKMADTRYCGPPFIYFFSLWLFQMTLF